MSEVGKLLRYM